LIAADQLLARTTFPPPATPVTCAVSGGADSLALMALAVAAELDVSVVHVDHQLRPESHLDAAKVVRAALQLGVSQVEQRVAPVEPGPNLEARARAARYAVMPADVLTGHTADDQAETVLLNLMRGAGLDGLGGMSPERHPLLRVRRWETRALCGQLGLEVVEDETNVDRAFRRNRVRHELLPLLDAIAERDVAAILSRQAGLLRDDAAFLDELARALDPTDAVALAAAPLALARRAIRRWLTGAHPPDAASVERVLAVANKSLRACEVGAGRRVRRSAGRLVLERDSPLT
jgi:tRNA(Ile)-lysidine synthase